MFGISQYPDLVKIEILSFSVFLCLPLDMLQLPLKLSSALCLTGARDRLVLGQGICYVHYKLWITIAYHNQCSDILVLKRRRKGECTWIGSTTGPNFLLKIFALDDYSVSFWNLV